MGEQPHESLWTREWEFLFRAAEFLRHNLAEHTSVLPLRQAYAREQNRKALPGAPGQAQRFSPDFSLPVDWIASRWRALYHLWNKDRAGYVFPDGFAALFFLRVLWANEVILLRGIYDANWTLQTSLERAQQRGDGYIAAAKAAGDRFIQQMQEQPFIRQFYMGSIPEAHKSAVLQHYGFPTDFLDLTYSYDIALYFAEGTESSRFDGGRPTPATGAIYAFAPNLIANDSVLVTLPPAIMRPTLQHGVFVRIRGEAREQLEAYKFRFYHRQDPVSSGISEIDYLTEPNIGRYLFPLSDPLELLAAPIRSALAGSSSKAEEPIPMVVGNAPEFKWLQEVWTRCLIDAGGRLQMDFNLLMAMCRDEPKSAQFAMQFLAREADRLLQGKAAVDAPEGEPATVVFVLGCVFTGYCAARMPDPEHPTMPAEIIPMLSMYPIIEECAATLNSFNP